MYADVFMVPFSAEFPSFDASLLLEALKGSPLFDPAKLTLTGVTEWADDMIDALPFGRTDISKVMTIIWWAIISLLVPVFPNNNSTTLWSNGIERVGLPAVRQF